MKGMIVNRKNNVLCAVVFHAVGDDHIAGDITIRRGVRGYNTYTTNPLYCIE